jgi:hypothetical protein
MWLRGKIMDNQIFDKACLGKLSTACWQGSKMLEPTYVSQLGDQDWIRARKLLVNPDKLNAIKAVVGRARCYLQKTALPFPISGLTLIPKDAILDIDATLADFQIEFWQEVESFLDIYELARAEAKRSLDNLFNEADYPIDIREKFRFQWQFLTLSVPGKNSVLNPALYEQEKQKFLALMDETRDLAIFALREEFKGLIDHMVDRLTGDEDGKPRQFKGSMVEKMNEFLENFCTRNIFQDNELSELVSHCKAVVSGINPDQLRNSDFVREHVASAMSRIKETVDENLINIPRRKIRFAA